MVWLIAGLLLVLLGGLAVFTRRARRRPVPDDTLIADLLGTPAGQAAPAPPGRMDVEPRPVQAVQPAPPDRMDAEPSSVQAVQPASEGNWLETQLAFITAWSERVNEQITSAAAGPDPPREEPEPAAAGPPADAGRAAGQSGEPSPSRRAPGRCLATTTKGGQCKLPAAPGATTCTIHSGRAHP